MDKHLKNEAIAGTSALQLNKTLSEKCERMKVSLETGRMTLNESRSELGFSAVDEPAHNQLFEKGNLIIS